MQVYFLNNFPFHENFKVISKVKTMGTYYLQLTRSKNTMEGKVILNPDTLSFWFPVFFK